VRAFIESLCMQLPRHGDSIIVCACALHAEPGALPALSGLKVIQGGGMCSCFGKQVEEPAAEGSASATGNPLYPTTS
jgi:hypothetical protein